MTEETVKKLEKEIDRATRKVNDKIRSWYTRLAQNNEISYADAKKLLKKAELEEFKWSVDEYIKIASDEALSKEWAKELENASSKAHITHLEQIKTEMRAELERMYKKVENQGSEALESVLEDGYSRTAFDYQKGLGIGWSFEAIDSNRLKTLLNSPWPSDGRNFSDRIWTNKNALLQTLEQELTQATLRGDTLQDMTDRVSKKLGVEKKKVSRLIHTETTYMNSLAAKESYKELGVDKVEILATLDKRTCETCADMDGIVINRFDMQPGVNAPPWHPNCRCTVAPWSEFLSKDKGAKRIARNEDDELYEIPADMTYAEWRKAPETEKKIDENIKKLIDKLKADSVKYRKVLRIVIPDDKIRIYALDPINGDSNKAKAFKSALGYTKDNADELKKNILNHIDESKFVPKGDVGYGMRYECVVELEGANGKKANVLTSWIQDGEDKRMTSVYVTKKKVTE